MPVFKIKPEQLLTSNNPFVREFVKSCLLSKINIEIIQSKGEDDEYYYFSFQYKPIRYYYSIRDSQKPTFSKEQLKIYNNDNFNFLWSTCFIPKEPTKLINLLIEIIKTVIQKNYQFLSQQKLNQLDGLICREWNQRI